MSIAEKTTGQLKRLRRFVRTHRLFAGLGVAIIATVILTLASLTIYKVGGFYRYDLSRPGYEKERTEIVTSPSSVTLDTTGAIDKTTAQDFIDELDARRHNIEAYNTFSNGGLSDEDLQLLPLP